MSKPAYRTMWMFPRNIRRIEPWKLVQIASILEACTANTMEQSVQDGLYDQLEKLGVKRRLNEYRVGNGGGFRTYMAQLACLGLFWKDSQSGAYVTTHAGELLMQCMAPAKVLRCQLLRMQYPSVYGLGHNIRMHPDIRVKPFAMIIRLLKDSRLGGRITSPELAAPVVYGHNTSEAVYEACMEKILRIREGASPSDIIDSVDDVRTTRRYNEFDPDSDLKKGVEDAVTIANTAANYLLASQIAVPHPEGGIMLNPSPEIEAEIAPWLAETKIDPLDLDRTEIWQQRYGRYNQTKAVRSLKKNATVNGLAAIVQTDFIRESTSNPFGFDSTSFIDEQAARWARPAADISRMIDPLRERVKNLEYEVVTHAASSGGTEARVLEKAAASIFTRLGFELTEDIAQKKAPREGGYPDVRVRSAGLSTCGFADTKASACYSLGLSDTIKLQTYYKDCWSEFPDQTPSSFFLYIAGGFDRSTATIERRLADCRVKYERPVSAITVRALLDLVRTENRPSAAEIKKAFEKGLYFASAEGVLKAAQN